MAKYLRIAGVVFLALTIILSCTVVGNKLTDPATYSHTIEALDKNRSTVLTLSAASAVASAAISTLPDDYGTPISEQLSEFTSWFVMILGFIFLEKYLLTILGAVSCYILIPLGCSALLVNCFFPRGILQSVGTKLVIFATALLLAIPCGVWVSDQINAIYAKSIEITVASASAVSDNLIGDMSGENREDTTVIDEAKAILDDVTSSVANVIEQFKNILNRFIEATAVMIVTTCLIPVLVVLSFVWLVKALFNLPIIVPTQMIKPKNSKDSCNGENRLTLSE